jgi:hypothetical protein
LRVNRGEAACTRSGMPGGTTQGGRVGLHHGWQRPGFGAAVDRVAGRPEQCTRRQALGEDGLLPAVPGQAFISSPPG